MADKAGSSQLPLDLTPESSFIYVLLQHFHKMVDADTIRQPNGLKWSSLKSPGTGLNLRKELLAALLKLGIYVFP